MKNHRLVFMLLFAVFLAACTSTPERESFGEYIDNSVVTTSVKSKLFSDPLVKGFEISVETYKGVVQLSGFVSTLEEKQQAEKLARQVNGVRAVKNNIIIKPR